MANTARRKIRGGKMFIPMNMKGNADKHRFFNVPKLFLIGVILFYLFYATGFLKEAHYVWWIWVVYWLFNFVVIQKVLRLFVFEENYFYKIYEKQKTLKNITPDLFWDISSIKQTENGAVLVYSDMKIGCIIRLERDTIVGKAEDSSEKHFDAWSDFYRELHLKDFKFVQMNLMEPAAKDPRLTVLGTEVMHCKNKNVGNVLEVEMGYLKAISSATLGENDYLLIYSNRIDRINTIIDDVVDCTSKLLNGAYAYIKVLNEKEVYEIPKSMMNIEFFDGVQAQMNVYRSNHTNIQNVMKLLKVKYSDGTVHEITDEDYEKIVKLSSLVSQGVLKYGEWSLKQALNGELEILNNYNSRGMAINSSENEELDTEGKNKKSKKKKKNKFNNNEQKVELNLSDDLDMNADNSDNDEDSDESEDEDIFGNEDSDNSDNDNDIFS